MLPMSHLHAWHARHHVDPIELSLHVRIDGLPIVEDLLCLSIGLVLELLLLVAVLAHAPTKDLPIEIHLNARVALQLTENVLNIGHDIGKVNEIIVAVALLIVWVLLVVAVLLAVGVRLSTLPPVVCALLLLLRYGSVRP